MLSMIMQHGSDVILEEKQTFRSEIDELIQNIPKSESHDWCRFHVREGNRGDEKALWSEGVQRYGLQLM